MRFFTGKSQMKTFRPAPRKWKEISQICCPVWQIFLKNNCADSIDGIYCVSIISSIAFRRARDIPCKKIPEHNNLMLRCANHDLEKRSNPCDVLSFIFFKYCLPCLTAGYVQLKVWYDLVKMASRQRGNRSGNGGMHKNTYPTFRPTTQRATIWYVRAVLKWSI